MKHTETVYDILITGGEFKGQYHMFGLRDKDTAERYAKEFAEEFGRTYKDHTCEVVERETEEWDNFFEMLMGE